MTNGLLFHVQSPAKGRRGDMRNNRPFFLIGVELFPKDSSVGDFNMRLRHFALGGKDRANLSQDGG